MNSSRTRSEFCAFFSWGFHWFLLFNCILFAERKNGLCFEVGSYVFSLGCAKKFGPYAMKSLYSYCLSTSPPLIFLFLFFWRGGAHRNRKNSVKRSKIIAFWLKLVLKRGDISHYLVTWTNSQQTSKVISALRHENKIILNPNSSKWKSFVSW